MMGLLMGISAGPRAAGGGGGGGLPVTANLVLHLDAGEISGLSDGDPIATWPDASGLENDAAQSTSGYRPTYKTGIINGLPVVRFPGGKFMQPPDIETTPAFTYFVVMSRASAANTAVLAADSGHYPFLDYTSWYIGSGACAVSRPVDTMQIMTGQMVPGSNGGRRWINGAAECLTTGNTAGAGTYYLFRYLCAYSSAGAGAFVGDIAEVIIYAAELDATDRTAVEDYLATKYGITLA